MTVRFTARAEAYLRQARRAAIDEKYLTANLRESGWIWDKTVKCWRHPDRPDFTIWPG